MLILFLIHVACLIPYWEKDLRYCLLAKDPAVIDFLEKQDLAERNYIHN